AQGDVALLGSRRERLPVLLLLRPGRKLLLDAEEAISDHVDLEVATLWSVVALREEVAFVHGHCREFAFSADDAHPVATGAVVELDDRSEEHTSELQSRFDLVCRL